MFTPSEGESFLMFTVHLQQLSPVDSTQSHTVRDEYTVSFLLSDGAAHVSAQRSEGQTYKTSFPMNQEFNYIHQVWQGEYPSTQHNV